MPCPHCCSAKTTERSDRTAHGYRRFRCRGCGRGFNERTGSVLNRLQLPTDVVFLIVLWRLRMKLSLRDLAEILLLRGLVFSHEAIRDWEAKLAPLLTEALRQRRKGKAGRSWYIRSYVSTATRSGLQDTPGMRSITPSFQEDTGYGRTACRCRFEGQAGRVIRQHRRSGEADRPAPGRSSAC